jgi:hypothetical protein
LFFVHLLSEPQKAFVATQTTSRKAAAVTASTMERPEMMIVSMSAQGAFLVHAERDSASAIGMLNVELSVRLRTPEIWAFDWSDTHIVEGTSKNSDCE